MVGIGGSGGSPFDTAGAGLDVRVAGLRSVAGGGCGEVGRSVRTALDAAMLTRSAGVGSDAGGTTGGPASRGSAAAVAESDKTDDAAEQRLTGHQRHRHHDGAPDRSHAHTGHRHRGELYGNRSMCARSMAAFTAGAVLLSAR